MFEIENESPEKNLVAMLLYTICFCCCRDRVLMLYRTYEPNRKHWNGLGGRIEADETPRNCVQREVLEEAGIDLQMSHLRFAGIVTWPVGVDTTSASSGMYAFVADLPADWTLWEGDRVVEEGLLCWKPLQWVCDPGNTEVVNNIPHFLPHMLSKAVPQEYHCKHDSEHRVQMLIHPLPAQLKALIAG